MEITRRFFDVSHLNKVTYEYISATLLWQTLFASCQSDSIKALSPKRNHAKQCHIGSSSYLLPALQAYFRFV